MNTDHFYFRKSVTKLVHIRYRYLPVEFGCAHIISLFTKGRRSCLNECQVGCISGPYYIINNIMDSRFLACNCGSPASGIVHF